jgi:hypothetical protein
MNTEILCKISGSHGSEYDDDTGEAVPQHTYGGAREVEV